MSSKETQLTDTISARLHIAGLAPSIKAQDLVDRFASFGSVQGGTEGVQGLGLDANGYPKTFAFLTLETTKAKLHKCTSMLSGSLRKGQKLRINPAKPDYTVRLAQERLAAEAEEISPKRVKKKRKKNSDPDIGIQATHFEFVQPGNIEFHKGWTLDSSIPELPTPLFPLVTRPPRPVPPPAKAATTSWTRSETAKARAAKALKAQQAAGGIRSVRPVNRARRIRIDPRKWGRKRIIYDAMTSELPSQLRKGFWECIESEDGMTSSNQPKTVVNWVFRGPDGQIKRTETVNLLGKSVAHTDRFTALLEGLNRPASCAVITIPDDLASAVEDKPLDQGEEKDLPPAKKLKSLSPPPYVPTAPRSLLYNEEDDFALLAVTQADEELAEASRQEKLAQLKLLQNLLPVAPAAETANLGVKGKAAVEGFADDDDDDDLSDLLRLRGGGSDEASDNILRLRGGGETSNSDSDSDDSDSDTAQEEAKKIAADAPKTTLARNSLLEMFKPQEAEASFSLLSGLDLELEQADRTPSPPPIPIQPFDANQREAQPHKRAATSNGFAQPAPLGRSNRAWIGTGPLTPFFPFPGTLTQSQCREIGIDDEKFALLAKESENRLQQAATGFWRTESMEEIEAEHQKLRDSLRGVARKRHREAAKKNRNKGANTNRRAGGGEAVAQTDE